ncbi:hypothetical protein J6590_075180 [Homalodisca vitripennis]|nr:hypothetical protein J6590_075180 [Homalodisca vitripennis]
MNHDPTEKLVHKLLNTNRIKQADNKAMRLINYGFLITRDYCDSSAVSQKARLEFLFWRESRRAIVRRNSLKPLISGGSRPRPRHQLVLPPDISKPGVLDD